MIVIKSIPHEYDTKLNCSTKWDFARTGSGEEGTEWMEGVVFYEKSDGCLGEWGWEGLVWTAASWIHVSQTHEKLRQGRLFCDWMMGQMEMSWNVSPRYEFLPWCTKLSLALQSACIVVTKQHFYTRALQGLIHKDRKVWENWNAKRQNSKTIMIVNSNYREIIREIFRIAITFLRPIEP